MWILVLQLALTLGTPVVQDPVVATPVAAAHAVDFQTDIAPLFRDKCLQCHGPERQRSGYRLDRRAAAFAGGEVHGPGLVAGDSAASPLFRFVAGLDPEVVMPPKGDRLTTKEVSLLRHWIDEGAAWPEGFEVKPAEPLDWWSLQPLVRPPVPQVAVAAPDAALGGAIDAFVRAQLVANGLSMSPRADDRTLCRRVTFDLIGLPPSPEELDAYADDPAADKYERLVDRLLSSPRYGERWARHWLDVVHYGDTHGYDKDQPRPHAWPYRDYVIRAFNADKPYARFVEEQLAGDVLYPGTRDGIEALGFLAAGPWDLIGHAEVAEDRIDGKIARHFDRDDMVGTAIGTFASLTVQCAQCHDHKFDPVKQADYYALQAVFAAIDRADKSYDLDPAITARRAELQNEAQRLDTIAKVFEAELTERGGARLAQSTKELQAAEQAAKQGFAPEYGWHSAIETSPDVRKWVQVDLGAAVEIDRVVLAGAHDDFNQIGDGFGFPVRFRIEASDDETFGGSPVVLAACEDSDQRNPGTAPQAFAGRGARARYVRVTVTRLAERQHDYIAALAELQVFDKTQQNATQQNRARGAAVTSSDSIESAPRWARQNLTDGIYPAFAPDAALLTRLRTQHAARLDEVLDDEARRVRKEHAEATASNRKAIAALPPPLLVYAGTVHTGTGKFQGTGAQGGKPRPIFLLARGQVTQPGREMQPAAIAALAPRVPAEFGLAPEAGEGERRAALARWLIDPRNPLTWRSIVNRVWQYHFGRGLCDTPNDLGRMGGRPTHPELLDWLAVTFRDDLHGSLRSLHRLIVTSAAYRQSSQTQNAAAMAQDSGNTLLWRGNARKLEAEAVHDAILAVSGTLDLTMGGPGWRDFVLEQPENSPHYRYDLASPDDPTTWRRSVYRCIVRSQLEPFLTALDCADPSLRTDRRNESVSPAQALALLDNGFVLAQARHFAERVQHEAGVEVGAQVERAFRLATGRSPDVEERARLVAYTAQHGLANTCRVLLNLSEFHFVD